MKDKLSVVAVIMLFGMAYGLYAYMQYQSAKEKAVQCKGKWFEVTYLTEDTFEPKTKVLCVLTQKFLK